MVVHKLIVRDCLTELCGLLCVALLIKLILILLKWKYIQDKNYAILTAMSRKRSYCVQKVYLENEALFILDVMVIQITVIDRGRDVLSCHELRS